MEKVAREAGVSKVTLYARYTNRHHLMCALLLAAVSNVATDIHSSLGRVPRDTAELREDLIHFADLVAAFLCSDAYQHLIQAISAIPKDMLDMTESPQRAGSYPSPADRLPRRRGKAAPASMRGAQGGGGTADGHDSRARSGARPVPHTL